MGPSEKVTSANQTIAVLFEPPNRSEAEDAVSHRGSNVHSHFDVDACRLFLALVEDKWGIRLLDAVLSLGGRARYSAIRRSLGGVSQKMLSQSLRKLERDGLIERTVVVDATPIGVEYAATELSSTMCEALRALQVWVNLHFARVEDARRAFDDRNR